jgi:hypothetical protein
MGNYSFLRGLDPKIEDSSFKTPALMANQSLVANLMNTTKFQKSNVYEGNRCQKLNLNHLYFLQNYENSAIFFLSLSN